MGALTVFQLEMGLAATSDNITAICCDNRQAYWAFSRRHTIPRYTFNHPRQQDGLFHVRRVDHFLTTFKQWMTRFNGVATRYLRNYVAWYVKHHHAVRWSAQPDAVSVVWLEEAFNEPL